MTPPEPIAIVSVACRLPGHANSPHKLWDLLQTGGIAVSNKVPESRFASAGHFDGSGRAGTLKALSGMFIEDIDPSTFDAPFFNLTRSDAIAMDPQQRQLLEVVYECFENGGQTLERVSGQGIACFVGSYTVDYHDIQNRSPEQRPPGMTVGIGRAILSNRISHFYNLKGPSWTIDTACSGGLIGVDVACQYLRAGKISGAVVAAVNLWLSPEHTQELGSMRAAYSPTGRCHTFDAKADGYCRAEAANAVYLKRLSEAIRDGDPIRAVIRGTANNSDGWTPGINSPSAEAQAAVIRAAYADAGIAASQYSTTGYLECHGTGTPTGDPLEVKGAASVLASMRPPSEPLIIGSIKSNIGHSEPAAGLSGLIKAVLAVESGRIPGNPTFVSPNPEIDFEGLGVRASRPSMLWPSVSNSYRRASVNAFGYGGSNAHVVLDNTQHFIDQGGVPLEKIWQPHASSYVDPAQMLSMLVGSSSGTRGRPSKGLLPKQRRPQLLVFSANDQDSLKRQIDALSAHLLDPRVKVKLTDLSYTFSQRRSRHYHRAFLLAYPTKTGHVNNIAPELSKFANTPAAQAAIRIGLVFTGQGAQWSQMGAGLVAMFPQTAQLLQDLDHVLQQLPEDLRPKWSLLKELTEPRSPEHLGNPEYSQALVTALQLAQLSVLASWNVQADVIVGHSSGEIAAACCAGFLSTRQAILVAYLRGFAAASKQTTSSQSKMGMMAVGLSAKDVQPYLDAIPGEGQEGVVIACYNSPASITLSGPSEILMILVETIKADGHFARILQVEVAYHSRYMSEAAIYYQTLLENHGGLDDDNDDEFAFQSSFETFKPTMISSVTEQPLTQTEARSPAYWKENMLSPVRFEGACRSIIANNNSSSNNNKTLASTDLFIELGPSNSLAGPVAQTAKEVGGNPITYTSAAKRGGQGGNSSIQALFDVAGQLFLHNAQVSLTRVNVDETVEEEQAGGTPAAVIIDLPNYKWNHSTPYWHESLASKDWRFKQFTEHDLLGSKILGTLWQSPSWHKLVRLEDLPWLRDHQIGSEILFPAAGYVAMAMEAIRQTALSMATEEKELAQLKARKYHYSLRDVQFPRGLVLEDDSDVDLMLLLSPAGVKDSESLGWWQFRIMSLPASSAEASLPPSPDKWNQNSDGMIRLEYDDEDDEEEEEAACSLPLTYPSPAKAWYKSMARVGYSYGPAFQKKLVVECMEGQSRARALISLEPPRSKWEPQSEYPLHPASLDGCIQSVFISLHRGRPSSFDKLLLPRSIGEMTVSGRRSWQSGEAVSVVFSNNDASSNASVYDPEGGHSIVKFRDVLFSPMDVRESIYTAHTYARLSWKPDFSHLDTDEKLSQALSAERPHSGGDGGESPLHELLDLAAHKTPNLSVFEFNLIPGHTQALWLDQDSSIPRPVRAATSVFHFASNDANTVLATEERYTHSLSSAGKNARFSLCDPFSGAFTPPPSTEGTEFDLVVVRWSPEYSAGAEFNILATSIRRLLVGGGSVIFYDDSRQPDTLSRDDDDGDDASTGVDEFYRALEGAQFGKIRKTKGASCVVAEAAVAEKLIARGDNLASEQDVFVVHFLSERSVVVSDLLSQLRVIGWNVIELTIESNFLDHLPANSTVLVLDEVFQPILATATEEQWNALQGVIRKECDVVWVTEGSQIEPTSPIKAICHGVFRTVRAEAAISRIVTLDIETSTASRSAVNAATIDTALRQVKSKPASSTAAENEFAERTGLLYVSRIWPDEEVNQAKMEDANYTSTKAAVGPGDVEVEIRGTAHSNVQPTKRRLASSLLDPGHSYLFVGGLKGVCGSLALHLAAQGAKNIAVMSRSGCEDDASQRVAHNIRVLGCSVQIVRGDVTLIEDVRRCFDEISTPIGGIIQGAAIFRDRTFESMSHVDYHAAMSCKVAGTTNMHSVSLEKRQPISFFTMLSSISGVVGQKGQANYAGGNAFQDAFARHRRAIGLPAISINLGPIEDVGVMQDDEDLSSRFDSGTWFKINEGLLRRIFNYSLLQQQPDEQHRLNSTSQDQMITGLAFPQPATSELLRDLRFGGLFTTTAKDVGGSGLGSGNAGKDTELQALFLVAQSSDPSPSAVLSAATAVLGKQLAKQLRLSQGIDPARQLMHYGMDSLAAVEFRNWVRTTLDVELTTLDVMNAPSILSLCDKVVKKMAISSSGN